MEGEIRIGWPLYLLCPRLRVLKDNVSHDGKFLVHC